MKITFLRLYTTLLICHIFFSAFVLTTKHLKSSADNVLCYLTVEIKHYKVPVTIIVKKSSPH